MTSEDKQALIQRILNIKTSGKANRFEITELAEIALAALTAPPVKLPTVRNSFGPMGSVYLDEVITAIRAAGHEVQES